MAVLSGSAPNLAAKRFGKVCRLAYVKQQKSTLLQVLSPTQRRPAETPKVVKRWAAAGQALRKRVAG